MDNLKDRIRSVPDFPKAGILFYDITTLLQNAAGFRAAIDSLVLPCQDQGSSLTVGREGTGLTIGTGGSVRRGAGRGEGRPRGRPRARSTSVSASFSYF